MMNHLKTVDESIFFCIEKERIRQLSTLEMIASENFVSDAVLEAIGNVLTNKYAEGYPGARYYNGCEFVDEIESLAIERAKELFCCEFANVQTHSGSQANQAVFLAFLKPGDTFMGLDLAAGGHLTHGCKVNQSGKWFNVVSYGVDKESNLIQLDEVRKLALQHKPKLIITGGSAYPRIINFQAFREIADEVGAYLMVDMAHFSGLVAGKVHDNPFPYAHIVTSTTHKTLRGARGGLILSNDPSIAKRINSAVFPGLQGGPLMNHIAGKAVAFYEALQPSYKQYTQQIVKNARALAHLLNQQGIGLVSGGTDTHLILIDLRSCSLSGNEVADSLYRAGITCNKNGIPFDPKPPKITSGVRLGTPALTTRGMKEHDMGIVASFIIEVIRGIQMNCSQETEDKVREKVEDFCKNFPLHVQ